MYNLFLVFASLSGMCAVIAGALVAHWLPASLDIKSLELFNIAVDYQFFNSLCLLFVGLMTKISSKSLKILDLSGIFLCLGICLFCGSLYLISTASVDLPSFIIPVGGFSLILGWGCLFIGSLIMYRQEK